MEIAYIKNLIPFLNESETMQLYNNDYLFLYLKLSLNLSSNKEKIVQMHILMLIIHKNLNSSILLFIQSRSKFSSKIFLSLQLSQTNYVVLISIMFIFFISIRKLIVCVDDHVCFITRKRNYFLNKILNLQFNVLAFLAKVYIKICSPIFQQIFLNLESYIISLFVFKNKSN